VHQGRNAHHLTLLVLVAVALQVGWAPAAEGAPRTEHTRKGRTKSTNTAPTISGTPATSVLQDTYYSFSPTASDADGNVLTFSVANLPRWATFNALSGELSGTPGAADVGTYVDIVIGVSDAQKTTQLPPFSIEVLAYGQSSATLTWVPPTENVDGTPLLDLAGYRFYWGQESRNYTNSVEIMNPGITTLVIDNLTDGTYYFAATAISMSGSESDFSAEVFSTLP
jgi:hypothetical protein